jgi:hypothetical protein
MGGIAFQQAVASGNPTLNTPRMSPEKYQTLKIIYLAKMRVLFPESRVEALKEAPQKTDYGDLDLLVSSDEDLDGVRLATNLGATGFIHINSKRCILGVPQDGAESPSPPIQYHETHASAGTKRPLPAQPTEEEYAQIDIEVVPPRLFEWHAFYESYGDMSGLLGQLVSNLGFTVNDKGLILRLKELDDGKALGYMRLADKDGMVFLSDEPKQVMTFLGLDSDRYDRGFDTMDDFYEWLARSRLLTDDYVQNLGHRRKNTPRQRQKETKRSIIGNFFHEYLPAHRPVDEAEDSIILDLATRRLQWQCEALAFFDKRDLHDRTRRALVRAIDNQTAEHLLKPIVQRHSGGARDKKLTELVRAFRRWVGFVDGQPRVLDAPQTDADSQLRGWLAADGASLADPAAVSEWTAQHWERLKTLERERAKVTANRPGS